MSLDAGESLPVLGDCVAELVVVVAQHFEVFAEFAVRGIEVFAKLPVVFAELRPELVGAVLLVPDDSHGCHHDGDELHDGVCFHV